MKRMLCLAGLTLIAGAATAQVEVKTHKVTDSIYMLEGQGGNIGVSAGPDGLLMIDTQFERIATPIREAMTAIDSAPLRFVRNTHFHG